jgi:hypothetical protein
LPLEAFIVLGFDAARILIPGLDLIYGNLLDVHIAIPIHVPNPHPAA